MVFYGLDKLGSQLEALADWAYCSIKERKEAKKQKNAIIANVSAINKLMMFNSELFGEVECVWFEQALAVVIRNKSKTTLDFRVNYLALDDMVLAVTEIGKRYQLVKDIVELTKDTVKEYNGALKND